MTATQGRSRSGLQLTRREFLVATAATTAIATLPGCPIEPAPPRDQYPFPYHHEAFGGDGNIVHQYDYKNGQLVIVGWARPQAYLAVGGGQVRVDSPFGDGGTYSIDEILSSGAGVDRVRAIFGESVLYELYKTLTAFGV